MEKSSDLHRRDNNGTKTLPCGTPDMTLTSQLRQTSTRMFHDWFDKNFVNIDNTEPQINTEKNLQKNTLMVNPIHGCTEINLHDPCLLLTLESTWQHMQYA